MRSAGESPGMEKATLSQLIDEAVSFAKGSEDEVADLLKYTSMDDIAKHAPKGLKDLVGMAEGGLVGEKNDTLKEDKELLKSYGMATEHDPAVLKGIAQYLKDNQTEIETVDPIDKASDIKKEEKKRRVSIYDNVGYIVLKCLYPLHTTSAFIILSFTLIICMFISFSLSSISFFFISIV